ncbi:MAG: Eco57I restriction-modification methylase domain-containing protein [Endozoicomonadaceae bacterium]|nr:Eco57I restriction-modification methylase domain-containing protein [Endozoicomonadaceae bacterium]
MDTSRLKKFAQQARRSFIEQVESKLNLVLAKESESRREHPKAVADLEQKLKELGQGKKQELKEQQQLIEQVAYIWFNRFCALRFMDVNQYNRIMVISPLSGQFQPEILAKAKAGHIDDGVVNEATREKVFGLLNGSVSSRDGQSAAYHLLIVAVCNDYHRIMPYLFDRINNYTELLMPDDLLSDNSILADTREAMTPGACESVESIGWLYQFYISEKKDEVFAGLKKNKKAAELAAFALTMKAVKGNPLDDGNNRRRFFRNPVAPNICRLENVSFSDDELDNYIDFVGKDLFTQDLIATLKEFEESDNFGSLIQPTATNISGILQQLKKVDWSNELLLEAPRNKVLKALTQADYLSPKYHVVIVNPPYMGGKGMNARLSKWAKDNYPNSKSDLFAMFIERNLKFAKQQGLVGMITMQSWMFLSSFEKLRADILTDSTILSMAHLGARAFDSIGGEVVQTTAFVLENTYLPKYKGAFLRLINGKSEAEKSELFKKAIA